MKIDLLKYRKENPLACRVIAYVVLFSSCVTLAATGWQLYVNFKKDLDYIEKRISQIRKGYEKGLSLGVWDLDNNQIYSLLGGIIQLPDIQYLEIRDAKGEQVAAMGRPRDHGVMQRQYPLVFTDSRGKPHDLGLLNITASLEGVYRRLNETVFQILVSQSIKTFLVSGFILLMIRHFITRHLSTIAQYMGRGRLAYLESPIGLQRPAPRQKDEIEQVVRAINRGREDLLRYVAQRDQKEAELAGARNYIDRIIDAMPSALVGVDEKGRVTQWNTGAETLTAVSRASALGHPVTDLLGPLGDEMVPVLGAVAEGDLFSRRKVTLGKADAPLFYEITTYPIFPGERQGMVILMENITERVKMEEMMLHNEKMHSVGMLAAGVAHEINNPINGVINLAQILKNDTPDESPEHDIASRITREGERVATIVSSLLSFSRNAREEKTAVAVQEIISETLALTEAQIRKEGTTLEAHTPDDLPPVRANLQQIQQVFLNVINNARFALNARHPGHHPDKRLEISCHVHTDAGGTTFIRTRITDTGTGIPKAHLARVTNPFYTTKPPGVGTGLGLSISRGIVEKHSGVFSIDSREGRFTTVSIDLPVHFLTDRPRDGGAPEY